MSKKTSIVIIFIISFLTFSNTLFMDFVWDDIPGILTNDLIKNYKNIPSFFTSGIPHINPIHYRPLVYTSLTLDYLVWGLNPFGFHLTNILLHAVNSILFFLILLKLTKNKVTTSFFTVCLFTVHPIHSDLVAWIMARADLLCTFFLLFTFYFYLQYKENKKKENFIVSFICFVFSLLSKEIAVMFPFVILLYDLLFTAKEERGLFKNFSLFFIPTILFLVARAFFLPSFIKVEHALGTRISSSLTFITIYFRLLLLPINLKVLYHELPIYNSFFHKEVIISFLLLSFVSLFFTVTRKKNKVIFWGYMWFLINLFPVSGLPKIIDVSPIAERYLYLPSLGFFIIIAEALYIISLRPTIEKKIKILIAIIVLIFSVVTFNRNYFWSDNITFLKKMVLDAPNYLEARKILANEYLSKDEFALAEKEYKTILDILPNDYETYNNLGVLYTKQGLLNYAEKMFSLSLKFNPNYPLPLYNLASIYLLNEKFAEAENLLKKLSFIEKNNASVYKKLGLVYLMSNKIKLAEESLTKALTLDPADEETRYYLELTKKPDKK